MIEQRTNEWMRQRLGKISASEIYVLMKDRKEPMTADELAAFKEANPKSRITTKTVPFSDATFSYLNKKVMENFLPLNSKEQDAINMVDEYIESHSVSNRAMEFGTFWEAEARRRYAEKMGVEVFEVGFEPYAKFPKLAGGSPDGLIREEEAGIEIKCPFTLDKHLQHCLYVTQDDLKENDEQYYWQCVMNMLVTDTKYWDFVSFNPYVGKKQQMKVLRVHRRDDEIALLEERIALAVEYIKEKINEIINTQMTVL